MNAYVKHLWIEALRSGRYIQQYGCRYYDGAYCCLGVLCDLAVKADICSRKAAFKSETLLSDPIMAWAELNDNNPIIEDVNICILNDIHKLSFTEIADKIDKYL